MLRRCLSLLALLVVGCSAIPEPTVTPSIDAPGVSADGLHDRAAVAAANDDELDCSAGEVTIDEFDDTVKIIGDCEKVTINGESVLVVAESIGSLRITGYGSVVIARSLDDVRIEPGGQASLVQYEQGAPQVDNRGEMSVVRKAD